MPGARRRGRPRTAWMDKIKRWTGLPVEESVRMTEDRDKRRKYVHVVANRRIEWSRTAEEVQNRTEQNVSMSQMLQTDARDGQTHSLCCSCSARRSSPECPGFETKLQRELTYLCWRYPNFCIIQLDPLSVWTEFRFVTDRQTRGHS